MPRRSYWCKLWGVPSLIERLRQLQKKPAPAKAQPAADAPVPPAPAPKPRPAQIGPSDDTLVSSRSEAGDYLGKVSDKMMKLAEDFAQGRVNRAQFEELYRHYLNERSAIEKLLDAQPASPAWKNVVTAGESVLIRRKHAALPLGYAIYVNATSALLRSVGGFRIDPAVLVSMLSAYRSATAEIFGSGIKSSEIEGGRWLCFVPGMYTTLLVVFSVEPARLQMEMLEQLHAHFERANRPTFEAGLPDAAKLVYPHAAAFE